MSALLLPELAAVAGLLLVAGHWLPARASAGLCGVGAALALLFVLAGGTASAINLPVGLPGTGVVLALDGFSAFVLLLLFIAAAAGGAPMLAGALALTVLAADEFSLVLTLEMSAVAAAVLLREGGRKVVGLVGGGVVAGLALSAALALQTAGTDPSFAGIRAHSAQGWHANAAFFLALLGAGGAAGLAPLHRWLPRAQAAASAPGGAPIAGAVPLVAAYLLIRLVVDLAGPAQPGWWGGVLLAVGAITALLGAAQAFRADDIRTIAGAAATLHGGLVAVGVGLALVARAADLSDLAAFALGAAFLLMATQAISGTLLALAMAAAETGAGTRRLDRLGGLLRGMPQTTACVLVAAATLATVPPSLGFAAVWTLFQALIGVARAGGPGWQAVVTLATLAVAVAVAVGAVAAVRLVGIAFLGRPRTPRAAAAQEPPMPARAALLSLAALTLALGAFPGLLLALAGPALRRLLGTDLSDRAGWLVVAPLPDAPGLAAAALAVLLILATLATVRAYKLRAAVGHHEGAAWEGGAAPPPPWLPFGDPATQIGPAGFADPLAGAIDAATFRPARHARRPWRRWRKLSAWADAALRPPIQAALTALLAVTIALLLLVVLA